jgi:hypothetical protein
MLVESYRVVELVREAAKGRVYVCKHGAVEVVVNRALSRCAQRGVQDGSCQAGPHAQLGDAHEGCPRDPGGSWLHLACLEPRHTESPSRRAVWGSSWEYKQTFSSAEYQLVPLQRLYQTPRRSGTPDS